MFPTDSEEFVPRPDQISDMLCAIAADSVFQMTLPEFQRFLAVFAFHIDEQFGSSIRNAAKRHAQLDELLPKVTALPFAWASELRRHLGKPVIVLASQATALAMIANSLKWPETELLAQLKNQLNDHSRELTEIVALIRLQVMKRELES